MGLLLFSLELPDDKEPDWEQTGSGQIDHITMHGSSVFPLSTTGFA